MAYSSVAELDRSAQLDSAAKSIDLRHIENSLLIFPPSSPPPPKNPNMCFSLRCFLFKVSPVSDVMMGILSGSLCNTIFLSLPRGLHTAYHSGRGQKCVKNYLQKKKKKKNGKSAMWDRGRVFQAWNASTAWRQSMWEKWAEAEGLCSCWGSWGSHAGHAL